MFAAIRRWAGRPTAPQEGERPQIDLWRLHALFNNFKRILTLNNAVLEEIAKMERALGGEYIFDRAFLESSVSTIANRVHHVAYSLNALTANRHVPLYDRYQEIRTLLDDILANNVHALADEAVLPLDAIGWEHEPLVGMDLVCLAELRNHPGIAPVDGFVVTAEGLRALAGNVPPSSGARADDGQRAGETRAALTDHLRNLTKRCAGAALTATLTLVGEDEQPLREIGCCRIDVDGERREALIATLRSEVPLVPANSRIVLADDRQSSGNAVQEPEAGAVVALLAHALEQIAHAAAIHATDQSGLANLCLFVCPQPEALLKGTIHTRVGSNDALAATDGLVVDAAPADGAAGDTYLLRRTHPFSLLQSRIAPRPNGHRFADQRRASDAAGDQPHLSRGSALLAPGLLQALAKTAMLLERLFGAPLDIHWQLWADGACRIVRLRPLAIAAGAESAPAAGQPPEAVVLCQGGQSGQAGVGAGPVVHVNEATDPETFPPGAVAVARTASPDLTPILHRAAALVTEFGSAAGHLATVARELRLPAVFGLPAALALLPPGTEVTVDGGEATVYAGAVAELLRYGAQPTDLTPQDREYRMLRRLLRFIQPLHLVNPEAPDFSAEGCRTFHDIIHFCHEMAVDELAHFQERRHELGALCIRPLALGLPMDIRLLDIGGGIQPQAAPSPLPEQIGSLPLAAFLRGLLAPQAWDTAAPSLGMRDILAGMPRSVGLLAAPADTLGANLAIIGAEYLNLSLRMGYHFSVIDAYLGEDSSRNFVYFRFAGGFADQERRNRRARFIARVLAAMEFKTAIKGDLVTARLKLADTAILQEALVALGALTASTRQQDTNMRSEADIEDRFADFAATFLTAFRQPHPAARAGGGDEAR